MILKGEICLVFSNIRNSSAYKSIKIKREAYLRKFTINI